MYSHRLKDTQIKKENYTPKEQVLSARERVDINISLAENKRSGKELNAAAREYKAIQEFSKLMKDSYDLITPKYVYKTGTLTQEQAEQNYNSFRTELDAYRTDLFNKYFEIKGTGFIKTITIKN